MPAGTAAIRQSVWRRRLSLEPRAPTRSAEPTAASINIISGNVGVGHQHQRRRDQELNKAQHNLIGTKARRNELLCLTMSESRNFRRRAKANTIGGSDCLRAGNVISGNNFQGRDYFGQRHKVEHGGRQLHRNKQSRHGCAAQHSSAGVSIFGGAQSNTIGGPTAASRVTSFRATHESRRHDQRQRHQVEPGTVQLRRR